MLQTRCLRSCSSCWAINHVALGFEARVVMSGEAADTGPGVEPWWLGECRQNHAACGDRTRPSATKWRPPGIEPVLLAWERPGVKARGRQGRARGGHDGSPAVRPGLAHGSRAWAERKARGRDACPCPRHAPRPFFPGAWLVCDHVVPPITGVSGIHVALPTSCQASGYIAQWLERLTADQQVPGSNPGVPFSTAPATFLRWTWE